MKKIDPKTPIENWRIEIVEDSRSITSLLDAAKCMSEGTRGNLERTLDKARINGERHLELYGFVLHADGSLSVGKIPGEKIYVLQIDLSDVSHPGFLARLGQEISLRKQRGAGFSPWFVHGHLKGNNYYLDYLELDDTGRFFLRNQRMLSRRQQMLILEPLP